MFSAQEVASYIAMVGVLSVVAQVSFSFFQLSFISKLACLVDRFYHPVYEQTNKKTNRIAISVSYIPVLCKEPFTPVFFRPSF